MWIELGVKVATALVAAVNMAEGSKTSLKGDDKRALALTFARQVLGTCGTGNEVMDRPDVQKALEDYTNAYVRLQNLISGKK